MKIKNYYIFIILQQKKTTDKESVCFFLGILIFINEIESDDDQFFVKENQS